MLCERCCWAGVGAAAVLTTGLSDLQWGLKCVVGQVVEDRRHCTVPASLGWRSCIRLIQFGKVENFHS